MAEQLGTPGNNILFGSADDDSLNGLGGDDTLIGGGGTDTLAGGPGNDTLLGHLGTDLYRGGEGADLFSIILADRPGQPRWPEIVDTVADFSTAEGDLLQLRSPPPPPEWPGGICACFQLANPPPWGDPDTGRLAGPSGRLPLVWTGATASQASLATGLALPGPSAALAPVAYAVAWVPDAAGGGWVVIDLERDAVLGPGDHVVRVDGTGPLAIGSSDFASGTFQAITEGTAGNDLIRGIDLTIWTEDGPLYPVPSDGHDRDLLLGGEGDDTLIGGTGFDVLVGGAGADHLTGGFGGDTYLVDGQGDRVFEAPSSWEIDTVVAMVSFRLSANLEWLTLAEAAGSAFGVGNAHDNRLVGNSGANLLIAHDGEDTIQGGEGDDRLFGQSGKDSLAGGQGADRLVGGDGTDAIDAGDGADTLFGEAGKDTLVAGSDAASDLLSGGDGDDSLNAWSAFGEADVLHGGAGDDLYYIDARGDRVVELPGAGNDTVWAHVRGDGYYLPANVESLVILYDTRFGVGNALANTLTGDFGANLFLGGDGDDTIRGFEGNDTVFGQGGSDTFVLEPGSGADAIRDFAPGEDKLLLRGWGSVPEFAPPRPVYHDFAELLTVMVEIGGSTAVRFGNGDLLVLNGVPLASLSATDVLFG
jgi:Ca2+-binding RTX toxin-like protein